MWRRKVNVIETRGLITITCSDDGTLLYTAPATRFHKNCVLRYMVENNLSPEADSQRTHPWLKHLR